jgi:ubiquinol-cytochrome c reductase cytochrome b subunit
MNKNLINIINTNFIKLPTPINISLWWNYGSLLGIFLIIQFIRGVILSIHYCPNINLAFRRIIHITQNVNNGWLIHNIHMNGASIFFICMYTHIARGIYYHSFNLTFTWLRGVTIFILSIATAFLGYVLPWGQISYWGATVITNLTTAIPYVGIIIIEWIWGGYSINNATLNRFFSFHFILPFIIIFIIILHLYFLHETGSKNPLGVNRNFNKIPFNIYFTLKDTFGFILLFIIFIIINLQYPFIFRDPDNFTEANPLVTPTHIQPEWYFLFAYAILRSIPNKLGGIIALLSSILVLYTLKWIKYHIKSNAFYPLNQIIYWLFINNFILLTYIGRQVIEPPFITIRQILSINYFIYFIIIHYLHKLWDKLLI